MRFIIRRKFKDSCNGAEVEEYETFDASCDPLARALSSGGYSETGYEIRELVGVELLEPSREGVVMEITNTGALGCRDKP